MSTRSGRALATAITWLALAWLTPIAITHAQRDTSADVEARAQFALGREAYDAGRYEDAVRAFRRAYILSPRFTLLYNVGQAELRVGDDARALEAFEGYLRQAPADDPHRTEVEERARQLRATGVVAATQPEDEEDDDRAAEADAPPDAAPPADVHPASGSTDLAPWLVLASGGVVAIVGAVLMGVGFSDAQRAWSAADGSPWSDVAGATSDANVFWGAGIALAAIGLAAAGAGLVWGIAGSGESAGSTVRLELGPAALRLEGSF
jgi:tetratricopeptide (TPR) repeat protein